MSDAIGFVPGFQVVWNGRDYVVQRYRGQVITYRERKEDADEICRLLNAVRPSPKPWDQTA